MFGSLKKVRGIRIEVTNTGNGLTATAPIVDFGPSIGQVANNIALDLTFATHVTDLHGTGLINVKYRFLDATSAPAASGNSGTEVGSAFTGGNLSERVPIPAKFTFNQGLSAVSEQSMLDKFNIPGEKTPDCSKPSENLKDLIVFGFDVGPFKVDGMKAAIDSLKQVGSAAGMDQHGRRGSVSAAGWPVSGGLLFRYQDGDLRCGSRRGRTFLRSTARASGPKMRRRVCCPAAACS